MATIGYGEDSLTYWALHTGRRCLLDQLGDDTPPGECTVFYRPSFGRSGGSDSPQFGEFDAILVTPSYVYLIESKWDGCSLRGPAIVLKEVQLLRHLIFAWLYESWCEEFATCEASSWTRFASARARSFSDRFPSRPLAASQKLLARNLAHIFSATTRPRRKLRNVLLYFHRQGHQGPQRIVTANSEPVLESAFDLVKLTYAPIGDSGYFSMAD